ncbi:MAG: hypothetical protein ACSHX0_04915 [Akkermansiaceae bacterium]
MSTKAICIISIGFSCLLSSLASAQATSNNETSTTTRKKKPGLVESSTLIASGGNWTLIPKSAAIYVPDRYKSKIVNKPTGILLNWTDFKKKNSGWIHTIEVTVNQARGKEVIDPKKIDAYKSMGKIIVATYKNGPISVQLSALLPPEIDKK